MEANSIGGDGPPGQAPQEKQWSEEELAMIHAAMMEELGVSRKDTLPLDDKGVQIHVRKPVKKQVVDDPNDPTARWRNIQFDDVDPAEAELDSMYDGQLYRLRKEAMGTSTSYQQGFSGRGGRSPGRGRDGGPTRGGHNGRGGSGRGGHDPGHTGRRPEIPNVAPHRSGRTPKTFFNNARRGMNNHVRIDALVSSLRAQAAQAEAEHQAAQKKEADALIAEQRRRASANAGSSRRPQAPTAMPRFTLTSQDAFLAYAGFNKPAPAKPTPPSNATQEPSRPSSPSVTSREDHEAPVGPAKVRLPQPPQIADSANLPSQQNVQRNATEQKSTVIHDILAKENHPHTVQSGDVGLAGSRWASTGPMAERTPSTTAAPPSPVLQPNTLATSGRTVLRDNQVKVTKGRGGVTRGYARLVKNNPQEDRYFTLELEVEGKNVLMQEIRDDDFFTCESTVITYRAKRVEDGLAPMPAVTWSIKFQMPYQAWTFYNPVASNPHARNRHKQPEDNAAPQSGTGLAAATPNQPPMPVENSDTVPKVRESVSLNAPEHIRAINAILQPAHASKLPTSALDCDTRSTAASAGSGPMSISNSSLVLQQEVVEPSSSPQRIHSSEWPLIQPIADHSSAGLLDKYQPGGSHRISSQALSEMNEVAGFGPLVSFGHDEPVPEPEPIHPWVQALLNMDDTQLIQSTFDYFEKRPGGSFLHQLSIMVARENVPPAARLTGEEILSSPKYQEAAESLVGSHLCNSETFSMMPDMVTIHYTTEKARKVLKKAVAHRGGQNMTEHDAASQSAPAFTQPEDGLSLSQYSAEPIPVQALEQTQTTGMVGNPKPDGPRVTYSAEHLLSLRQNASRFRSELVSREVAYYVIPQEGVVTQEQLRRQTSRRNVGGPAFKPTTSVGAWQAYSVAESSGVSTSGVSTEPSRIASPVNERPSTQPTAALIEKPTVQNTPLSNDSGASTPAKIEPVRSLAKPANTIQTQETDMALWGALLTTVQDNKKQNRIRELSSSKPQTPLVSSRGSGHVPTNSECDRLAKTFEGLDLSKERKEETSTQEPQPVAASDACIAAVHPSFKDHAPLASSLTMYEKIKESLKSPLTLFSRPKSTASTVKSDTGSIPPTPVLTEAKSVSILEVKAEHPMTAAPNLQSPAIPAPPPANYFKPESSVKVETLEVNFSYAHASFPGHAEPAPSTSEIEPKNIIETGPERASVPVNAQPTAPTLKSEDKTADTVAPTPQMTEKALPFFQNVTNKDLKGAPGLKASKWASEPVAQAPVPRARPPPMATATPIFPIPYPHAYAPPHAFDNVFASPPPVHVTIASNPPALQTVLVADLMRPGYLMEVTGIARDQFAQPVLPPMSMPPMMSPHRKQENVPYYQQTSLVNFEPRPEMYRGHKSKSSGSDLNFDASSTPFTPSRGRGASAISPQHRDALSPVRQGENVQAKLQSRLNSSLAGRSPNA